jgi:NAD(P)-dependent dehydrogenase (short-subunit alcohol dehydrogenase family)
MPTAAVLGARNLGGAVARHLAARGWRVASVARTESSFDGVRDAVALTLTGDAADPADLERVLATAREELGGLDLVVNAVSASRPPEGGGPFGGGPIADATLEGFRGWGVAVAEQAFVFLSTGARVLRAGGSGGTLVQVTGGSARRAFPGRGSWAAGTHALRALTHAAAQELREEGIHVTLLIADGTIASPKSAGWTAGQPPEALLDQDELAHAVAFLAAQTPRGLTHELVVTPSGDRWTP